MLHGVACYTAKGQSQVQCKCKGSSAGIMLPSGLLGVCMDCCAVAIQIGRPVANSEPAARLITCLWPSVRLAAPRLCPRAIRRVRTAGAPGTAPAGCRGQTSARTPYDTALDPRSFQPYRQ